ncbi:methionyl-tRNA formyltransferase [Aminipila terrae]|uniref:methionyl-tRNA formyltransferase n=1 Tax=Aminipila terrae TaxID=2697030 RepID=UPI001FAE01EA|nr:hypothetical protein [Aminipila terrae]
MIFKKDGEIDFSRKPEEIERLIRGLDSWPGAYSYYKGQLIKIWGAEILDKSCQAPDGTIVSVSDKGIDVSAGGSMLRITIIQMPGKKRMAVSDYLKGNKIYIGELFEKAD